MTGLAICGKIRADRDEAQDTQPKGGGDKMNERDTRTLDATTELMVRKAEAASKLAEMEKRVQSAEKRPAGARFSDFYRAEARRKAAAEIGPFDPDRDERADAAALAPTDPKSEMAIVKIEICQLCIEAVDDAIAVCDPWPTFLKIVHDA